MPMKSLNYFLNDKYGGTKRYLYTSSNIQEALFIDIGGGNAVGPSSDIPRF